MVSPAGAVSYHEGWDCCAAAGAVWLWLLHVPERPNHLRRSLCARAMAALTIVVAGLCGVVLFGVCWLVSIARNG